MKNMKTVSVILLGVLSFAATSAVAEKFGRSYAEFGYEYSKLNEVPAGLDDDVNMFGLGVRLGGAEHMDAVAHLGFGRWEDFDLFEASAGVQPYFKPEDGFYKVFADFQVLYAEIEHDDSGFSESDVGFSAGAGSELSATDNLSFIGLVKYVDIFSDNDIEIAGSVNFWLTDWMFLDAGIGYAIDADVLSVGIGAGIGF